MSSVTFILQLQGIKRHFTDSNIWNHLTVVVLTNSREQQTNRGKMMPLHNWAQSVLIVYKLNLHVSVTVIPPSSVVIYCIYHVTSRHVIFLSFSQHKLIH